MVWQWVLTEVDNGRGGSGWKGKDVWWGWRRWVTNEERIQRKEEGDK